MRLARVGIERVSGFLEDGIAGWARAGLELTFIEQIPVAELQARKQSRAVPRIFDVRRPAEWSAGRIPGAELKPLDQLRSSLESLGRDLPVAVCCKGGYRSTIACSLLESAGFTEVFNVVGGFDAWVGAGLPVESGA